MKSKIGKLLLLFALIMLITTSSVFAIDIELEEAPYTEAYQAYLELSDEEKAKVLEPQKYDIKNTVSSTNEALLSNERITLKNLLSVLRASNATSSYFSLKNIISNNVYIRNQETTNLCWAFSTLSSLETNLALQDYYNNSNTQGSTVYDYSEKHMAYSMTQMYSDCTNTYGYNMAASDGGTYLMATSYLTNGQGAVDESAMEFDNDDTTKVLSSTVQDLDVQTTVDSIIYFDTLNITTADKDDVTALQTAIKEHIVNYGSVYAAINTGSINYKTGAIYSTSLSSDHAISIVGWDDDYSKDNFTTTPSSDGAWIIRNSWGESTTYTLDDFGISGYTEAQVEYILESNFGDYYNYELDYDNQTVTFYWGDVDGEGAGYYYVSYEDASIYYTQLMGIVSADSEKTYDSIYLLDEIGVTNAFALSSVYDVYMANVFTRTTTETEYLSSVGLTSLQSGTFEVYINTNGTGKSESELTQVTFADGSTQITLAAGYNTIDFKDTYELTGTNFVVVVKWVYESGKSYYFSVEKPDNNTCSTATSNSGESFITTGASGYFNKDKWYDIGDENGSMYCGNLCIRAITVEASSTSDNDGKDDGSDDGTGSETDGGSDDGTDNDSDNDGDDDTISNSDYSSAAANITSIEYSSSSEFEMVVELNGVVANDEDATFEHYFYLNSDSSVDTDSISDSKWAKVDSFTKEDDGTYTIVFTITEDSYWDDVDTSADYVYVYIKEIATKDSLTSTYVTSSGFVLTADLSSLNISSDEDDDDSDDDTTSTTTTNTTDDDDSSSTTTTSTSATSTTSTSSDTTVASSVLPYTGKTMAILVILGITSIFAICVFVKYRDLKDVK